MTKQSKRGSTLAVRTNETMNNWTRRRSILLHSEIHACDTMMSGVFLETSLGGSRAAPSFPLRSKMAPIKRWAAPCSIWSHFPPFFYSLFCRWQLGICTMCLCPCQRDKSAFQWTHLSHSAPAYLASQQGPTLTDFGRIGADFGRFSARIRLVCFFYTVSHAYCIRIRMSSPCFPLFLFTNNN